MTAARAYLDHNATSPLRPEARAAMLSAMDVVGNPSSIHAEGRAARTIIEAARDTIAAMLGAHSTNLVFTSGGTEAANMALYGASQIIAGATEHVCVLQCAGTDSATLRRLGVDRYGIVQIDAPDLSSAAIVAVQAANNETGVLQPLTPVAEAASVAGAMFVCDAVQVAGRMPFDIGRQRVDSAFISAHKFGGPKGAGAILWRSDRAPLPLLRGGGQERRRRAGTENVAAIAGMAAALKAAVETQSAEAQRLAGLRGELEAGIRHIDPDAVIFGEGAPRLPNTTCFAVPCVRAEMALIAFDLDDVSVSSGSACSSGKVERSHVLKAMGISDALCDGAIRLSTGWTTTEQDIERFLASLTKICRQRRIARAA